MVKLDGKTPDLAAENIEQLRQIFPDVFEEGKIDFDKLKQVLGEYVDDEKERYNFTWNGKGKALRLAQTPTTGTLRPCEAESKNWDDTQNLYIEGDNLEVLKLLQKSYHGKIKMIYIDPPYNTGGDFVYPDDFSDSIENYKRITGQVDEEGKKLSPNTESNGRYHTDWLSMMYPRLRLAKNLLKKAGVIFISVDEHEEHNLRKLCDEVFGAEHFIASVAVVNNLKGRSDDNYIATAHEWLLIYHNGSFETYGVALPEEYVEEYKLSDENGKYRLQGLRKRGSGARRVDRPNMFYPFYYNPQTKELSLTKADNMVEIVPKLSDGTDGRWRWGKDTAIERLKELIVEMVSGRNEYDVFQKDYLFAGKRIKPKSVWFGAEFSAEAGTLQTKELLGKGIFETPKSVSFLKYCLEQSTHNNDIVLDFFSGSATTAHAVMQLNAEDGGNRKFIMVQLPEPCADGTEAANAGFENICEIGKERIRRAGEKIKAEIEEQNAQLKIGEEPKKAPDIGFKVFKLDSSNLKKWNPDVGMVMKEHQDVEQISFDTMEFSAKQLELDLLGMVENYVEGRSELDVVYEIMLKMGMELTWPLETHTIGGKNVYEIGMGALMICLDDHITTEVAEGMAVLYKELAPETWRVVFKDNGFADDSAKVNIKEILKTAGLEEDAFTTV